MREPDGTPLALGYHTGHWEVGLLVRAAAEELAGAGRDPLRRLLSPTPATAAPRAPRACSTACPTATTPRMVLRRLMRSLPTRRAVIGVGDLRQGPAGHDDGAGGCRDLAARARARRRDAAAEPTGEDAGQGPDDRRALRARPALARGGGRARLPRLRLAGRRLPVPGHRGHRAGRRRSARPDACRTPRSPRRASRSGSTWRGARRARRCSAGARASTLGDILTDAAVRNAMAVHAAFGGSTNLLLHVPAIAHAAGLPPPHGRRLEARQPPRAAPGGRRCPTARHPTVRVFLAGGVPEVMLHLRRAGPARPRALTVDAARTLGRGAGLVGGIARGAPALRARLRGSRRRRSRRRDHEPRAARRAGG